MSIEESSKYNLSMVDKGRVVWFIEDISKK
jgi:hypothetical protein